jgi:hypothetical protein
MSIGFSGLLRNLFGFLRRFFHHNIHVTRISQKDGPFFHLLAHPSVGYLPAIQGDNRLREKREEANMAVLVAEVGIDTCKSVEARHRSNIRHSIKRSERSYFLENSKAMIVPPTAIFFDC